MITKTFQNNEVPALGLGTYRLNGKACEATVCEAIEMGYHHIDCAAMYENEDAVGMGIKKSGIDRRQLFITTKVWHDQLSAKDVKKSAETSLKKLALDYVDLLLIHWPGTTGVPLEETLTAFDIPKREGKTRFIGVSNFPPSLFRKALDFTGIFCNQVEYHPYLSQQQLIGMAQESGVAITAYRPLAKGKTATDEVLADIGKKYGKNGAQVALRWLMQQNNVLAIPRTSNPVHLKENLDIFDFSLTTKEMERIGAQERGERMIDPAWVGDWED